MRGARETRSSVASIEVHASALLRDAVEEQSRVLLRVTGSSMAPLLAPGDQIRVVPARLETLTPGDVVVLSGPDPVVHRYLYATRRGLVTRGDANRSHDFPWPESRLLGKATARIRGTAELAIDRGWGHFRARLAAAGFRLRNILGTRWRASVAPARDRRARSRS